MSLENAVDRQTGSFLNAVSWFSSQEHVDEDLKEIADQFLEYEQTGKVYIYPHERVFTIYAGRREKGGAIVYIPLDFSERDIEQTTLKKSFLETIFDAVYYSQNPEDRDRDLMHRVHTKIDAFQQE